MARHVSSDGVVGKSSESAQASRVLERWYLFEL